MNSNIPKPESLYRFYSQTRRAQVDSDENGPVAQQEPDIVDNRSLASSVYRLYQSGRDVKMEDPVDAIMSLIRADSNDFTGSQSASSRVSSTVENDSDDNQNNVVGFSGRSRKSKQKTKTRFLGMSGFRLIAPAIAATFLVFFVVPMVFDLGEPNDSATVGMLKNYRIAASLIEQKQAQSLGFSAASVHEQKAFNTGLLATEITVSALGGESVKLSAANQQLSELIEAEKFQKIGGILDSVQGSMHTAHDVSNNDSIRADAARSMMRGVSDLLSFLRSTANTTDNQLWFDVGRQIQAMALFTHLKIEFDIATPMKHAMLDFNMAELPDNPHFLSKLLTELKHLSASESFSDEVTHRIMVLCRDIKILMQ